MSGSDSDTAAVERLAAAGLPSGEVRDWLQSQPRETGDFAAALR